MKTPGEEEILVVAEDQARAEVLCEQLAFLERPVRVADPNDGFERCGLLVWQGDPDRGGPGEHIDRLPGGARVVLVLPRLNPRWIAHYLRHPQVGVFLAEPLGKDDIDPLLARIVGGAIADLDHLLPAGCAVQSHKVSSYEDRCEVLDLVIEHAKANKLRGKLRRSAELVTEELLMNAMYHAPVDENGVREFADVDPRSRIASKTPRPVDVRFAVHDGAVFVAVRDNYGSFLREDLAKYLLRGAAKEQIDDKRSGAGLGLFQITSTATRFFINIAPGKHTDFVCVVDPPEGRRSSSLRVMTVVSGPRSAAKQRTSMNLSKVLAELRELMDEAAASGGVGDPPGQDTVVDWPVSRVPARPTMVDWPPTPDELEEDGAAAAEEPVAVAVEITAELPDESMWRSRKPADTASGEGPSNDEPPEEEDTDPEGRLTPRLGDADQVLVAEASLPPEPAAGPVPVEPEAEAEPTVEVPLEPEPEVEAASEPGAAEPAAAEPVAVAESGVTAEPGPDRIAALWDTPSRGRPRHGDKPAIAELFTAHATKGKERGVDVFARYSTQRRGAAGAADRGGAPGSEDAGATEPPGGDGEGSPED